MQVMIYSYSRPVVTHARFPPHKHIPCPKSQCSGSGGEGEGEEKDESNGFSEGLSFVEANERFDVPFSQLYYMVGQIHASRPAAPGESK